ncbi:MAG TPA: NADP-dependent succinic semialdehyde dehydrogenase [Actinocrinis sp.]|jgi:succinate-semialdehyde dehydrogenase/glutarate-semialdehyde dehydrogenase
MSSTIRTVNPATGATLASFEALGPEQIETRLARAAAAFASYRTTDFGRRAQWLERAAELLEQDQDAAAQMMTAEMGKPVAQARAEAVKCAKAMRWFAARAGQYLADERFPADDVAATGAAEALVRYRPLGVVLAVMPWNFPMWQVIRFAAPALMAGNACLLKHASNVPQTAQYLEDLFARAGQNLAGGRLPEAVFQTLLVGSDRIEGILRDPRVAAATVTGSEGAGRAVASVAGDEVKKTVLELGGSDPFLVLPSADIPAAAKVAVTARVQNNGQSCIAAKRFIVHEAVYDEFTDLFTRAMAQLRVGDPQQESTEVGPVAGEQARADLEALVEDAVSKGAKVLCGAGRPADPALAAGSYYLPTVLADVTEQMRIYREEAFGPVAALFKVADLDEAIAVANDVPFGLSSNAWTRDEGERERLVRDLEAGAVFFNGMTASHPALPFGGIKRSGYGRELSALGIREFCNATTVWIAPGSEA